MTFLLGVRQRPPTRHQIGNDRDVYDTIKARCHAQAQSCTPKQRGGGLIQITSSP
jgi:hypothetical protein